MQNSLSPELLYLALISGFTAIIWIPIIINRLGEMGLWPALKNPEPDQRPAAPWANRAHAAHQNAIENLVVFAPLALIIALTGQGSDITALFAAIFFFARVAHTIIYILGVPVLRTIAFAFGFIAQMVFAAHILRIF